MQRLGQVVFSRNFIAVMGLVGLFLVFEYIRLKENQIPKEAIFVDWDSTVNPMEQEKVLESGLCCELDTLPKFNRSSRWAVATLIDAAKGHSGQVSWQTKGDYQLGLRALAVSLLESKMHHVAFVAVIPQTYRLSPDTIKMMDNMNAIVYTAHRFSELIPEVYHGKRRWIPTFSKLHIWNLTQFEKVLFLDADQLVMENMIDLFLMPELTTAGDYYYFQICGGHFPTVSSGVLIIEPNSKTFQDVVDLLRPEQNKDGWRWGGGDQDLIKFYFTEKMNRTRGEHFITYLPPTYTMFIAQCACEEHIYDHPKVIHFTYNFPKPWLDSFPVNEKPCYKKYYNLWYKFLAESRKYIGTFEPNKHYTVTELQHL